MKEIKYSEFAMDDAENLINFLSSYNWPFHSSPKLTKEKLRQQLESGYFNGEGKRTYLILDDDNIIGVIYVFDLGEDIKDDETPLFDIKISDDYRGKGIGKSAVKWLCDFIFTNYPKKLRFEATTRVDNIAMRKVLEACGFLKEAHYRLAWPDTYGNRYDCAGYSLLKEDWLSGKISKIDFNS